MFRSGAEDETEIVWSDIDRQLQMNDSGNFHLRRPSFLLNLSNAALLDKLFHRAEKKYFQTSIVELLFQERVEKLREIYQDLVANGESELRVSAIVEGNDSAAASSSTPAVPPSLTSSLMAGNEDVQDIFADVVSSEAPAQSLVSIISSPLSLKKRKKPKKKHHQHHHSTDSGKQV